MDCAPKYHQTIAEAAERTRARTGSYSNCVGCSDKIYRRPGVASVRKRCGDCANAERLRIKRENARSNGSWARVRLQLETGFASVGQSRSARSISLLRRFRRGSAKSSHLDRQGHTTHIFQCLWDRCPASRAMIEAVQFLARSW